MIGQTVSHYKIVEKLGGGGMGVVYKAEDTKLGRFVALKFLPDAVSQDRQAVERFMIEARAAASLSHPHICTIHEIDEHEGVPFIAMEYLEGQNLKFAIAAKPMATELVVELGIQIAEALAAAHAKGITHRDVKPSNIFLSHGGQIKVVDFGLAKFTAPPGSMSEDETIVADAPTQTADLTGSGTAMGTVAYMSPEQALGQEVDTRTDLFSLGAVLYEMVTGRQAFMGSTQAAVFDKILNRPVVAPARLGLEIPYELEQILSKSLEKNKVLRYQSSLELHTDLRRVRRNLESGHSSAVAIPEETGAQVPSMSGSVATVTPMSGSAPAMTPGVAETELPSGSVASGAAQLASGSTAAATAPVAKNKQTVWIMGALLVAAIVVIAILLKPEDQGAALSEGDVLLLTDFVNTTGDPVFDGTLKQALAVKLEESPYLNILSQRQVQDTLRLMNRPADERVTPEIGQEICERRAIKAMVTGEVASLGENYVVTLNAVNCQTGESLAARQFEVSSKEEVLSAVGQGAVEMRSELGESLASIEQFDAPIEDATTSSLEALKAFAMGDKTRNQATEEEAIPYYKRALELDPDFAFAHARLGNAYANLREFDKAVYHKTKAYELRDEVSERERLYITGHYHGTVTGDMNKLIETYEQFKQAYPRVAVAPNNLCSDFNKFGWFERALEECQLALSLDPEEPLHYSNTAQSLRFLGRLDESKALLDEALDKGFVRSSLYRWRYLSAYIDGDQKTMEKMVEAMSGVPGESEILYLNAEGIAASGRLEEANRLNRRAIDTAKGYGFNERVADLTATAARWDAGFGLLDHAAAKSAQALEIARSRNTMPVAAATFALAGAIREAEAMIEELTERYPETDTEIYFVWLPIAHAALELQRNNAAAALEQLEIAAPYERGFLVVTYLRGQAYLMLEQPEQAKAEFSKIIELRGVTPTRPVHTLAILGLGRALAASGEATLARLQYEKFLDLVRNSDDGLPVIEAARDEYPTIQ